MAPGRSEKLRLEGVVMARGRHYAGYLIIGLAELFLGELESAGCKGRDRSPQITVWVRPLAKTDMMKKGSTTRREGSGGSLVASRVAYDRFLPMLLKFMLMVIARE